MLAERAIEWTQQWKEEGLREGLQQGLEAERALLVRLARKRFGEACAQALTGLLGAYTDTAALEDVGEWLITADSGETFLARMSQR